MRRFAQFIFAASLVLVAATACVDNMMVEELGVVREGVPITVRATLGDVTQTKTAIQADGASIYWTPNDAINLFYGNKSSGKFTTTLSEPKAVADFTGTLTVATGSSESGHEAQNFWGVYPYNAANTCDGNSVTLPIPVQQSAAAGTFADKLNPTVATSSNLGLAFYNVGSWFIFSVTQEGVTSATFRGNDNEDIAGRIRVSMDANSRPTAQILEGAKSITITAPNGGSFTPGDLYYIVLLPQTLEQGYTLTLHKGDLQAECVVTNSAEFVRSSFRRKRNADAGLEYTQSGSNPLTGNITFADNLVKSICVANWDTNGDGELSYEEAAAVTDLGSNFQYSNITSFNELQFFTGVSNLEGTFQECIFLEIITLPEGLTQMGEKTFKDCSSLTSITIPESVSSIGNNAFSNCTSLTSILIPENVSSISNGAFEGCSSLTSITIPESLSSIGGCAFCGCSSLTSIMIPENVSSIGEAAFMGCSSLTSITIPESVSSIGNNVFYGCSGLTSFTIPESVSSIDNGAFMHCTSLTSITIPESVSSIEIAVFYGCTSLTNVYVLATIPPDLVTDSTCNTFGGGYPIFVPAQSLSTYKAAMAWSYYADRIFPIEEQTEPIGPGTGHQW